MEKPYKSSYKVLGIATDVMKRDGEPILIKGQKIAGAVGWYRVINPIKKLGGQVEIGLYVSTTAENAFRMKERGDLWFMKLSDNEGIDNIYATHRDITGAKLVIDLDDAIDNIHPQHPDYEGLKDRRHMRIRMVKIADHLVVATEEIKEAVKHLNPYITVIPNAIDPAIWKVKNKKWNDKKIRIGWMSSGSHFVDAPIIEDIMQELLKEYPNLEFHVAGMVKGYEKGDRWFHHQGTTGYDGFPEFYASLGIDIAIAPIKDIPFNRCKTNIKFMEAAMLEIPTVASDVAPYKDIQHGKTGYLATTPGQFKKYLKWLIDNEAKRKEIGKAANKYVMDNWTIDKFLPKYRELFDKIMEKKDITVITAITGDKDSLEPQPEYPGVEYVAFVENDLKDSQWKTRKACDKFAKHVMNAKIHKILSHKYCDTPYIVWMDGNCSLKQDPHELIKLMGDKDFAFFKHPGRDCLFEEADACVNLGKGNIKEIAEQMTKYAKDNFPEHAGLCECTCFIRKNNDFANDTMEKWWTEITRFSNRDQISFPVVFKDEEWATIPGTIAYLKGNKTFVGNKFFNYSKHKRYEDSTN